MFPHGSTIYMTAEYSCKVLPHKWLLDIPPRLYNIHDSCIFPKIIRHSYLLHTSQISVTPMTPRYSPRFCQIHDTHSPHDSTIFITSARFSKVLSHWRLVCVSYVTLECSPRFDHIHSSASLLIFIVSPKLRDHSNCQKHVFTREWTHKVFQFCFAIADLWILA